MLRIGQKDGGKGRGEGVNGRKEIEGNKENHMDGNGRSSPCASSSVPGSRADAQPLGSCLCPGVIRTGVTNALRLCPRPQH